MVIVIKQRRRKKNKFYQQRITRLPGIGAATSRKGTRPPSLGFWKTKKVRLGWVVFE